MASYPPGFPLQIDAFRHGANMDVLAVLLNRLAEYDVGETGDLSQIWIDGTNGDDSNDGLTATRRIKTFSRFQDIFPANISNQLSVNLRGTFDASHFGPGGETHISYFHSVAGPGTEIVWDGGPDTVVVAGPWTADSANVGSIGLTSLTETPEAHVGYWIEILDGPAIGETRVCYSHTSTTFVPNENWSTSPGSGATFQISRPATTIKGNTLLSLTALGSCQSVTNFQRIYQDSAVDTASMVFSGTARWALIGVVSDKAHAGAIHFDKAIGGSRTDLILPGTFATDTLKKLSLSQRATGGRVLHSGGVAIHESLMAAKLDLSGCVVDEIKNFDCRQIRLTGGCSQKNEAGGFQYGNRSRVYSSPGVGFYIENSTASITGTIDISNSATHGIEVKGSTLNIDGVISGTGNSGAGLRAHTVSGVTITDGSAPTLTGTVGEISIDGVTQISTWAALDGTTAASNDKEQTVIKNEILIAPADSGGSGGGGGTWTEDEFTAATAQTVFTLSSTLADTESFSLHINGVLYDDGVNYTVVGTTLTWLDTPFVLDGEKLHARYLK